MQSDSYPCALGPGAAHESVGRVEVRANLHQHDDGVDEALLRRLVERRVALVVGRLGGGAVAQQAADGVHLFVVTNRNRERCLPLRSERAGTGHR
jgi:hypothetical protein